VTAIEIGRIDRVVKQPRLRVVEFIQAREAPLLLDPFADQRHYVNSPPVRRVI
jgi:hypothetical protein